jgi:hypothetical protein
MKKTRLFSILAALLLISNATVAMAINFYPYNPAAIYNGKFSRNAIYYHNPKNPNWQLGLKKELNFITCRPALESLKNTGTWKGHFNPDGSCGPTSEPVEFAVGNWLNFSNIKGK